MIFFISVATITSCRCSVVSPAFSPLAAHSPYSHVTLDDHNRFVMAPGTTNAGGVDPLDVKPVIGNQQADYQRMMQHAANMGMAVSLVSLKWFTKTMEVGSYFMSSRGK